MTTHASLPVVSCFRCSAELDAEELARHTAIADVIDAEGAWLRVPPLCTTCVFHLLLNRRAPLELAERRWPGEA